MNYLINWTFLNFFIKLQWGLNFNYMSASTKLFDLIKSLSQSERGYIKKSIFNKKGEDAMYLRLFDLIHDLEEYDEDKFLLKHKKEKFVKNFSKNKNQLYNVILKRLSRYYENSSIEIQIKETIAQGIVLYKKGLFQLSSEQFEKALHMALENEEYASSFEICIHLTRVHGYGINGIEEDKKSLMRELIDNLNKEYKLYDLNNQIRDLLFIDYSTSIENRNKVLNIINNPALDTIGNEDGIKLQLRKLMIKSHGYHILHEDIKHREAKQEYYNIVTKNEIFKKNNPEYHLVATINLINSNLKFKDFKNVDLLLNELKNIDASDNSQMNFMKWNGYYLLVLMYENISGNYSKDKNDIEEILKWVEENKHRMSDYYSIEFNHLLFNRHFITEKYKECIPFINNLKNTKSEFRKDQQLASKIHLLVLHYELKNYALIEYLIRSVYREFMKYENELESEKYILRWMQKLIKKINNKETLKSALLELKDKMHKMENNQQWTPLDSLKLFIIWMNSKIEEKSMIDIIKEEKKELAK